MPPPSVRQRHHLLNVTHLLNPQHNHRHLYISAQRNSRFGRIAAPRPCLSLHAAYAEVPRIPPIAYRVALARADIPEGLTAGPKKHRWHSVSAFEAQLVHSHLTTVR